MTSQFQKFRELHFQESPLLLGNVWNVQSALVYDRLEFGAIATSSAAVAHSLGYEDGENMPFDDYLFIIERIAKSTKIPVSVDLEAGFGDSTEKIISNILKLNNLGIAGINIEDSVVTNSTRIIQGAGIFTEKLNTITNALKAKSIEMFINVRCDAYLLNFPDTLNEAKRRIKLYETASVDGLFLPGIVHENDIKEIAAITPLPLNVMCMPALPSFETLKRLGVKRISMGNFINGYIYRQMGNMTEEIIKDQSFSCLF